MRIETKKQVREYFGKDDTLFLVSENGKGGYDFSRVRIVDDERFERGNEFFYDEFGWVFESQPLGLRSSRLADVGLFTTLEEAKAYVQECVNETTVGENPAGDSVGIYKGSMTTGLEQLDNELFDWTDDGEYMGCPNRHISLKSIYEQAVEKKLIEPRDMLTVFCVEPLSGVVYNCGNYSAGDWTQAGTLNGYA